MHQEKKHKCNKSKHIELLPAYPWEYIRSNVKNFRYIVMNYFPNLFDQKKVKSISKAIIKFIKKYVYPSWRVSVEINFYVAPLKNILVEQGVIPGTFINSIPQPGTFIPIYLVDEFSDNIENNFATAVHGCVSGSVMNGIDALFYLNGDNPLGMYGPLPFGTPFIVIPMGTIKSGNGINAEVEANKLDHSGPTDFYQCLSVTMCHEIIETLINPGGMTYIGSGNPLGLDLSQDDITNKILLESHQIFYIKEAVDPFSHGKDNLFEYKGWTMTNFAYPAYFYPYNKSGIYDFLGNSPAPFTPYKGSQFFIYQEKIGLDVGELQVGNLVSPTDDPCTLSFISGGSIYLYDSWGLKELNELNKNTQFIKYDILKYERYNINSKTDENMNRYKLNKKFIGMSEGLNSNRRRSSTHFMCNIKKSLCISSIKCKKICHKCNKKFFNQLSPQVFPFQYVDNDNFLTCRFAIINYSFEKLPPIVVDKTIPIIEKYISEQYLPYWNIKVKIIGNYTIKSSEDLPKFDGTFIPFFILKHDQFNQLKLGGLVTGGAFNLNNNPNILSGPFISEYVLNAPKLPLGCPYLLIPDANFPSQVLITTDQIGVGPYIGIPSGASNGLNINYPIVAQGIVASPDINACSNIKPIDSMVGKIGINIRAGCDSSVYPKNMEEAGAIATITIFTSARSFTAPGSTKFNCTIGPEGQSLIDAVQKNPNMIITISAPGAPINISTTTNIFTSIITHEMQELSRDPTYAEYITTSNPPSDNCILFSQYEASDPVESFNTIGTLKKRSCAMNAFPTPAYFIAKLRYNNYDNTSTIFSPLIPQSRQQILYQVSGNPLQVASTLGLFESTFSILDLDTFGSIFDAQTFYPPGNPYSYQQGGFVQPIVGSPLENIYDNLLNHNNIFFI